MRGNLGLGLAILFILLRPISAFAAAPATQPVESIDRIIQITLPTGWAVDTTEQPATSVLALTCKSLQITADFRDSGLNGDFGTWSRTTLVKASPKMKGFSHSEITLEHVGDLDMYWCQSTWRDQNGNAIGGTFATIHLPYHFIEFESAGPPGALSKEIDPIKDLLATVKLAPDAVLPANKKKAGSSTPPGDGTTAAVPNPPAPAPDPAATLHADISIDTTPITGPSTEPANQQATIKSLEVQLLDTGAMAGQTSEVTLTLTPGDSPTLTTVQFVTPVGDEMRLARDEALRYIHLTYPNWNVDKAEVTFEDKYDGHDGGSIGAALGTLILSDIQGFDIDPDVAITGDISANGKVRAIGGLSAKLKGAIASKCTVVAVPSENYDQLVDGVVYNGLDIITDVQVIGITNLKDAVAIVRADRDAKLSQAIALFATFQVAAKDKPAYLTTAEARDILTRVLKLAPQHLSAKILLAASQGSLPKTLSATASYYYTSLAIAPMLGVLNERAAVDGSNKVPSTVVRAGLQNLAKLRPLVDPKVQPLIDDWSRFIQAWNALQQGTGSLDTAEATRQRLIEESVKEGTDADMMQKMLKEGI